jgi:hypothetical protein
MDVPMAASNQGLSPFILEDARSRLLPCEDSQTCFFFSEESRSRFGHPPRSQASAPSETSHMISLFGDEQHAPPNALASALPANEDSLIILDACPSSHTSASAHLVPEHVPQTDEPPPIHDAPASMGPVYVKNEPMEPAAEPQSSAMPHPQVRYGAAVSMGAAATVLASAPPQSPYLLQFTASQAAQTHQPAAQPPPPPQNP